MSFDFCEHCGLLVDSSLELEPTWLSDRWGTWKEWLCMLCLWRVSHGQRSSVTAA